MSVCVYLLLLLDTFISLQKRPKSSQAKDESLDEEANQHQQLMLMKKQAEQKIAILQGQKLDLDEELEQIQTEMVKERAMALREQEERLGAMITALQMERAREVNHMENLFSYYSSTLSHFNELSISLWMYILIVNSSIDKLQTAIDSITFFPTYFIILLHLILDKTYFLLLVQNVIFYRLCYFTCMLSLLCYFLWFSLQKSRSSRML